VLVARNCPSAPELGDQQFSDQSTVTVHVRRLREKVEPDPAAPRRTVWGVGYRYEATGRLPTCC
jgi:DNA-binding response OmpR family regulator